MAKEKPTLSERIKDAAVGSAALTGIMTAAWSVENRMGRNKSWMPVKGQWKITAIGAAIVAAYGFLTAKKKDVPEQTAEVKKSIQNSALTTNETVPETTKFRDMVATSRTQTVSTGKGV